MKCIIVLLLMVSMVYGGVHLLYGYISPEVNMDDISYTAVTRGDYTKYPGDNHCFYQTIGNNNIWVIVYDDTHCGDSITISITDHYNNKIGMVSGVILHSLITTLDTCYMVDVTTHTWDINNVYPAPFNSKEATHTWSSDSYIVDVFDINGRVVASRRKDNILQWDGFSSGVYLLRPHNIDTNESLPIIKVVIPK